MCVVFFFAWRRDYAANLTCVDLPWLMESDVGRGVKLHSEKEIESVILHISDGSLRVRELLARGIV